MIELLARLDVVTIKPSLILEAIDLHRLHPSEMRGSVPVPA